MRTPPFWYPKDTSAASLTSDFLVPFSSLFNAGSFVRRTMARQPYRAAIPVVCVGNVVAGGAGKTPTALALARILKAHEQKPVFVTRGYGSKGVLTRVNPARHGALDVGDEALLLAKEAPTWACKDRAKAIRAAEQEASVIILDDGLQNPHFVPSASFLVIDGEVGVGNGRVIPAGPLREPLDDALERVAAVIISGESDRQGLAAHIQKPVFRAHLQPSLPQGFPASERFIAFAGIARPDKFYATAKAEGLELVQTRDFPDHHAYTAADIAALRKEALAQDARLLTTEKDSVRLPSAFRADVLTLPVRLVFDDSQAEESLAALALSL